MAQTTTAETINNAKLEVSTDGSTWTDISGSSTSVTGAEQGSQVFEENTLDGQDPIVKPGNKDALTLDVRIIYTETAGEAFETVRAQWETSGRELYIRYSPAGGASGDYQYTSANSDGTTTAGILESFTYPDAEADGGIGIAGFTVRVPALAQSAVA